MANTNNDPENKAPSEGSVAPGADNKTNTLSKDGQERRGQIAYSFKVILQGVIGVGIVLLLSAKLIYLFSSGWLPWLDCPVMTVVKQLVTTFQTLEIVSHGLAYAAGVELAYMLFTPGPDEAVEPLILGLAAAILASTSKITGPNVKSAFGIGISVAALAGLFVLRALFTPEVNGKPPVSDLFTKIISRFRQEDKVDSAGLTQLKV